MRGLTANMHHTHYAFTV